MPRMHLDTTTRRRSAAFRLQQRRKRGRIRIDSMPPVCRTFLLSKGRAPTPSYACCGFQCMVVVLRCTPTPLFPALPIGEQKFFRPPPGDRLAEREVFGHVFSDETFESKIAPALSPTGAGPLRKEFRIGGAGGEVKEVDSF